MTRWRFKLLFLVLIGIVITVFFIHPSYGARNHPLQTYTNHKKTVLTVGYLTAIKGEMKDKQGLAISGALKMALDEVNTNNCVHAIRFHFVSVLFFLLLLFAKFIGSQQFVCLCAFQVNNDRSLLPNVTLALRWNDTRGDTVLATRAITEMICDGVATIFGPEGSCHVEAIVSQSRNIPMISYVRRNISINYHYD